MHRYRIRIVATLVAVTAIAATIPAAGQGVPEHITPEFLESIDDAQLHGTITPPGAEVTEKSKELIAYDSLVQGYTTLTEEEITSTYFKDGLFREVTDIAREYFPRSDVRIVRDAKWGVPHIYGETDAAAAFGAGYAAVEDRLPIIMALNALGRSEAFEMIEDTPTWLADAETARLYGYTEAEFQAMIDRLPIVYGQHGQDIVDLLTALVNGMNHAVADMQAGQLPTPAALGDLGLDLPGPFSVTDIVSIVSIVRSLFGAGGGGELGNAARWIAMIDDFGPGAAQDVWDDMRTRLNDDGPLHTPDVYPYAIPDPDAIDPASNVFAFGAGASGFESFFDEVAGLFPGGVAQARVQSADLAEQARIKWENVVLDTPAFKLDFAKPGQMSNYLVVDGTLSSTGFPILLGGPQAGYFDPQILVENEIHGDRLHARGAGFPGMGFVVIGRNQEAAWTPTAGGSDMIDIYVEVLCEPDGSDPTEKSTFYMFDGECIEMDRRVIRTVTDALPLDFPGRDLLPDIIVERTIHGPIVARGLVGEDPVAASRKRSTYMKELDAAISILKLNRNEVPDGQTFVDTFEESHNLSTNWAFANSREIAYVHGGLYPTRPSSVNPDFPVWGTGEWEWAQNPDGSDKYLTEHPNDVMPDKHYTVSWNNRVASGWSSADNSWERSALYRVDMLEDQILAQAPGTISPVKMVQMMEQAGLTDFRGSHVLPVALRVLKAGSAPSPREEQMVQILEDWIANGSLRRDGDEDGSYDHGTAVAIMDAWWAGLIRAVFDPVLGDIAAVTRTGFDNAPNNAGSAYQGGMYGAVWTQLTMALDEPLKSPTSQSYCGSDSIGGDGVLATCAQRLWDSLKAAGDALGGSDPTAWNADPQPERIIFLPTAALSMHWVNRPTTQGIAMFGRFNPPFTPDSDPAPDPDAAPLTLPTTGGGAALVALTFVVMAALNRRRQRNP